MRNDDGILKESITLFEIIRWLSIEESKKTSDIYEVYKNVNVVLEKIYNYKIPFHTVRYTFTTGNTSSKQVQVLECENYLVEIMDFLKSLRFKLAHNHIVNRYVTTIGLIDKKKQAPKDVNKNLFREVKLDVNHSAYKDMAAVLASFQTYLSAVDDGVIPYVASLLRRCGMPRVLKRHLLQIDELNGLAFEDNYPYGILFPKATDCTLRQLQRKKQQLNAQLSEARERIDYLERFKKRNENKTNPLQKESNSDIREENQQLKDQLAQAQERIQELELVANNSDNNKISETNTRLFILIGAMLHESKNRGFRNVNQGNIVDAVVEMNIPNLAERAVKGYFADANKEFNPYKPIN